MSAAALGDTESSGLQRFCQNYIPHLSLLHWTLERLLVSAQQRRRQTRTAPLKQGGDVHVTSSSFCAVTPVHVSLHVWIRKQI